jgi:hypothetical protein
MMMYDVKFVQSFFLNDGFIRDYNFMFHCIDYIQNNYLNMKKCKQASEISFVCVFANCQC